MFEQVMDRLGFCASLGMDSVRAAVDFALTTGLRCVELSGNVPLFFPERYDRAERVSIAEYAKERGVALCMHAPEDLNLMTPHESMRLAAVARTLEFVKLCSDIGASRLTVHPGTSVYFSLPGGRSYLHDVFPDEHSDALRRSLASLGERCGDTKICIENTDGGEWSRVLPVLEEAVNAGGIYLTWDIGHSFRNESQQSFMRRHLPAIKDVHVHDHDGIAPHKVVGAGILDVREHLVLLCGMDAYLNIETRPAATVRESVDAIRRMFPR